MQDLDTNKSFSFSSKFKYSSSSLALVSDDDDGEYNDQEHNKDSDTDENSFIEIAFDNPTTNRTVDDDEGSGGHRGLQDNLDHLRISFSSSFPASVPDVHDNIDVSNCPHEAAAIKAISAISSSSSWSLSPSVSLSASTLRSSSTGTCRGPAIVGSSESFSLYESSRRRDQLPAFNPLVHTLLFSLEAPPETAEEIDGRHAQRDSHRQLAMINADNRSASSITQATDSGNNNHGIVKFLMIKFRATKVRKLLTSLFAKSRGDHLNVYQNKANDRYRLKRSRPSKESLDYYYDHHHHHHQGMYLSNDNINAINDIKYSSHHQHKCSRALDVNLGAVRGVLEAVNMTSSTHSRTNRKTGSCPSSVKSSPMHQGFATDDSGKFFARENSIQAAIAHCKSSLGQSSDFRF
ncbi:hypothetical protein PanWU01x14_242090 [Parasponia andersonii]|uniref:Uncharacterized protein n=1 Tax=Parasponia andersonii TaxID=3476 RepID=A0A2P5BG45_PARAD|nr:hypothetical protein PanWU01x14_242090 [Parasponia andersonii]